MEEFYVRSKSELCRELEWREKNKIEINNRLNDWTRTCYGIENFCGFVEKYIPPSSQPLGVIARAVPSIVVEECMVYLTAKSLSLIPLELGFNIDAFSMRNCDKFSRTKLRWIEWSKKGNPIEKYEKLANAFDGQIMAAIGINGINLVSYHSQLREQVFGEKFPIYDFSQLFSELVMSASRSPQYVYGQKSDREEKLFNWEKEALVRPPAQWMYPLYLALFLVRRVLFESWVPSEGQIYFTFTETMRRLSRELGIKPLIVLIPEEPKRELLALNKLLLKGELPKVPEAEEDLFSLCEKSAKLAYEFGRPDT